MFEQEIGRISQRLAEWRELVGALLRENPLRCREGRMLNSLVQNLDIASICIRLRLCLRIEREAFTLAVYAGLHEMLRHEFAVYFPPSFLCDISHCSHDGQSIAHSCPRQRKNDV